MKKVLAYSLLLVLGLIGSQVLPKLLGDTHDSIYPWIQAATMVCLAYIMIGVGREFDIDKTNLRQYAWDYGVGATAAAFPWIFCCLYFVFVLLPQDTWSSWPVWKESLLASRFAAPTSAGVLFSMLAAAGLAATWMFRKARILAIFDDLDTILLMIPLKMAMVGFKWQLAIIVVFMAVMIWIAYRWLHSLKIPSSWQAMLLYSLSMVGVITLIHNLSMRWDPKVPIHFEVLLPAFVLGCVMWIPKGAHEHASHATGHMPDAEERGRQSAGSIMSGIFMLLVGLSMPSIAASMGPGAADAAASTGIVQGALVRASPSMGWGEIALHVLVVTVLANLGKMFPALCYRREAKWQERLALSIGMWPRGEVGAGVLVISLSYGIGGPVVVIAMLSLALNLVLTGVFILAVKKLLVMAQHDPRPIGG